MKFVKKLLLAIVAIIALLAIVGLFIKKDFHVHRSITIAKPKDQVFDFLLLLKNQNKFSKWAMMDPSMEKIYKGTDGTVGFVYAWNSKNEDLGKGEQEIKAIVPGERIDYYLRFIEPFKLENLAYFTTTATDSTHTTVEWGIDGRMPYPLNLMTLFISLDESMGNDLQTGLNNLKTVLEQ